jgi:hypothetical protein
MLCGIFGMMNFAALNLLRNEHLRMRNAKLQKKKS